MSSKLLSKKKQKEIALLYQLGVHEYDLIDAFKLTEEELLTLPHC